MKMPDETLWSGQATDLSDGLTVVFLFESVCLMRVAVVKLMIGHQTLEG